MADRRGADTADRPFVHRAAFSETEGRQAGQSRRSRCQIAGYLARQIIKAGTVPVAVKFKGADNMPHVSIEFSKGLEQTYDIQSLCGRLFAALAEQNAFEDPAAIKIRASPVEFFRIGSEPQTFVHATLLLMRGRDQLTRTHLNKTILEVISNALPDVGSITVKDVEMTRATYAARVL
ncbi:5-carboxymethyl-2-hydroxymuconate Delta-isomerase [Tritonibacter mobilis]|uniref:5-carboxymethyl-2-hydroxymuconate Delta-isomerase n=1 Tax=Tritonibacter mobilis TaxID=379347 RepID=UPI001D0D506C|nr:hypothetical protein [Tritonibacter mobilis]